MWMAHGGPEVADSCSCVAETMAEDRPICHDLSIRKTRFPSTVDSDLYARGFERCRGTLVAHVRRCWTHRRRVREAGKHGERRRSGAWRRKGEASPYTGPSPLKSPGLSDTSPTRSEVASSA
jgi:hypothetical protein